MMDGADFLEGDTLNPDPQGVWDPDVSLTTAAVRVISPEEFYVAEKLQNNE